MWNKIKYKIMQFWFKHGGIILPRITAYTAYLLFTKPIRRYPTPNDQALLENAQVINGAFEDLKIHGYSWGSGGKSVLLLHGWNSHALSMRKFVKPLLELGFKVLVFDAPSHGYSEGGRGSAPIYQRFIQDILLKYKPQMIIAHSLGGLCTLVTMAKNPEIKIDKLAVMSMPASSQAIMDQFIRLTSLHKSSQDYFLHYVKTKMNANFSEFNMTEVYKNNIDLSGIIVHDINDEVIPYHNATQLSQLWPKAKTLTTNDLGHSGVLKDEATIRQIIEFIMV